MRDSLIISTSVIIILSAIVYSINTPIPITHFTEFYLYQNSTNLTYGITNYEGKYIPYGVKGYLVESESDETIYLFDETVTLKDRDTFTKSIYIGGPKYKQITGESTNIESNISGIVVLELYREDLSQSGPYRTLHFNISQSKGGSNAG